MSEFILLSVLTLESVDADRWNRQIADLGGPMQLTTEWAAYVRAKDRVHPYFCELVQEGQPAYAIFYLARSSRWPLSRWPSAFADCLPVGPRSKSATLADLERVIQGLGAVEYQQNSFAFDGLEPVDLAPLGFTTLDRLEFDLSLRDGLETVWNGFRPTLRNDIRRFERSTVICVLRTDAEVVEVLHQIEHATTKRHQTQGKIVLPMALATYCSLWATLVSSGRARIYVAEQDGEAIAFAVLGALGERAYYIYGGATPAALRLNAPKALLWFAAQQEYGRGVRHLNLGGMNASAALPASVDHGLYKFKTAFGASSRRCLSGRKIFKPTITAAVSGLRRLLAE